MSNHPKPWCVRYMRVFEEWHPKCRPYILDKLGGFVVAMPQTVDHPGEYDELADNTAKEIVAGVNSSWGADGL